MSHFERWHLPKKNYSLENAFVAALLCSTLQAWPSLIFLWKCYQHHGLCCSTASLILTAPYHISTSLSFHIIPTMGERETVLIKLLRAHSCFECHLKAILTSWITAEIPMISEQADPVLTRLRPSNELSVWHRSAFRVNPPTLISIIPEETGGRLWLKWEKKNQNGFNITMLQK